MDDLYYLRDKYGPFYSRGLVNRKWKCDFCHTKLLVYLKVEAEQKPGIYLHICFSCTQKLLGKPEASDAWLRLSPIWATVGDSEEFDKSMVEAEKKLKEIHPDAEKELVEKAKKYRIAGFGMKWKTVSGIIDFYGKKEYLTDKQRKTLKGYIAYCRKELER